MSFNVNDAGNVRLKLPNGTVKNLESLSFSGVAEIARAEGMVEFNVVNNSTRDLVSRNDFPLTSGEYSLQEYNEVK